VFPLLSIPNTVLLLKACWQRAEERVIGDVETKYREADEEFITKLVCGELRAEFERANSTRQFEKEFAADLARSKLRRDWTWIASGLIARMVRHPGHVEARTGGDFGFLVARPQVGGRDSHPVINMHAQGLLVQAKKQRPDGRIGALTRAQEKVLPSRLDYAAFVLYMYDVPNIRLAPFGWLCPGRLRMQDLKTELARLNGLRPRTVEDIQRIVTATVLSSTEIIEALSQGTRGTSDASIIREQICPDLTPSVQIEITWREGKPPEPPRLLNQRQVHVQIGG
jgi:hypothetical protein